MGYRRLVAAIEAAGNRPARDIVEQVLEEADAFSAGARRANDMTLWLGRLEEALSTTAPLEAESMEAPGAGGTGGVRQPGGRPAGPPR